MYQIMMGYRKKSDHVCHDNTLLIILQPGCSSHLLIDADIIANLEDL